MTTERIKEIQNKTAYPDSLSVQQALLQVWNECEQEKLRIGGIVRPEMESAQGRTVGNSAAGQNVSADFKEGYKQGYINATEEAIKLIEKNYLPCG